MSDCQRLHPLLCRVAEGEATPEEAIRTARHLSDCTACRIVLARERRLAEMLEQELDEPLHVGEEFVRTVMANLPKEPPPRPSAIARRRKNLRAVKLAGWLAALAVVPVAAARSIELPSTVAHWTLPVLDASTADGLGDRLIGVGGLILALVDSLSAGLPVLAAGFAGAAHALLWLIPAVAMTGFAAAVSLLALATRGLAGPPGR